MKRLLFIICALLFVSAGAFGQYSSHQKTAQDTTGKALSKALIKVCALSDSACSVASTIYSDNAGTAKANPFTAGTDGNYEFWAAPGDYTVQVSKAGFLSYTYHVSLGVSVSGNNVFTGTNKFSDLMLGSGVLSDVRFYGAKGDCTTDDTAAFQAALDANFNKRPVYVPAPAGGVCYRLNSSLLFNQGNALVGTGVNASFGGPELDYYGADGTHAITQKANSATNDTSKVAVINLRIMDKRTSPTSGDGVHFEFIDNGNFINQNVVSGFPGDDIYVGGPSGKASDVTQIMDNWVTSFGVHGIHVERLNNNVVIGGTRCDSLSPATGTACVYVANTSMTPTEATVSIRDTKGEINNGAHLIWLDTAYGAVSIDSALMRGNSGFNGLGGDTLHITGTEGQSVTAINLHGGPVCTNVVNIVTKSKVIPCTANGPRIRFWMGGADGLRVNTGAGFFGVPFSSDANDETMYGKGRLVMGPCDGSAVPFGTCLGANPELFTLQSRSIGEIPLKIFRFSGQTAALLQISSEANANIFKVNADGSVSLTGSIAPATAAGAALGTASGLPFSAARIGTSGTAFSNIGSNATTQRNQNLPDIAGTLTMNIANGTSAMGTGAITTGTCATVVTTAATGALATDSIAWAFNAAPGTGYTAGLHVLPYVTAGNVNFLVCNPTAGSLTPAAATLNWKVTR